MHDSILHDYCVHDYLIIRNNNKIYYSRGICDENMIYLFIRWSKVAFGITSTLVDSHVQFCEMIVKSDVSVYQIFQRFRFGKNFPSRWTAKPYSHLPIPLPFLLNSLFFFLRFPLLSRFFSFLIRLTFARAFLFPFAVTSEIG